MLLTDKIKSTHLTSNPEVAPPVSDAPPAAGAPHQPDPAAIKYVHALSVRYLILCGKKKKMEETPVDDNRNVSPVLAYHLDHHHSIQQSNELHHLKFVSLLKSFHNIS